MSSNKHMDASWPLLEEIKIQGANMPNSLPAWSLNDQLIQSQRLTASFNDPIEYQNDSINNTVRICNSLIAMGFKQQMVFALIKYCDVTDPQSAMDLLIKTDHGWQHTYIPNRYTEVCEICDEPFKEHIESTVGNNDTNFAISARQGYLDMVASIKAIGAKEDIPRTNVICKICMEGVPLGQDFYLKCGHIHCQQCIESFLTINILNGSVLDLKCPEENCNKRFTKQDIQTICKSDVYEKYLKFRENIEVNSSTNMRWCPAPNCGRYIERKNRRVHLVCECGFHMCFKCGEAWHPKVSCKKNYDKLYSSWANGKRIQRCPNCKIRIEKDEGCNHMTCTFCKHQWCWICGQNYRPGHYENLFFGCPNLQFTSKDYSLKRIALINFLLFLLCPLLCLYWSFVLIGQWYVDWFEDSSCCCSFFKIPTLLLVVLVAAPIVTVIMVIPSFLYRLYNLFFVIKRGLTT